MTKRRKSLMVAVWAIVIIIITGTVFYHYVEDWN